MKDVIDQVLAMFEAGPADPRELEARQRIIVRLFAAYGERDEGRARLYVEETAGIPLRIFALAVRALIRERVYPDVPSLGNLWQTAKAIAGMHREQYRAGRYLPPATEWPPEGQRHAITAGRYEPLPASVPRHWLPAALHEQIEAGDDA